MCLDIIYDNISFDTGYSYKIFLEDKKGNLYSATKISNIFEIKNNQKIPKDIWIYEMDYRLPKFKKDFLKCEYAGAGQYVTGFHSFQNYNDAIEYRNYNHGFINHLKDLCKIQVNLYKIEFLNVCAIGQFFKWKNIIVSKNIKIIQEV